MISSWSKCKIGDIITLNYGKSLTRRNRMEGNIPVYGSSGITGFHNVALVNDRGIIIGRKGNVGSIFKSEKPFYCIDTAYYIKESDRYNLNFIFYLLQTLNLKKLNFDTAVPGLNRELAYQQNIILPPKFTQESIASILSSLDEKIELNLEMNKTLEEMAMAIYKEWFVDFDSFRDGEFVESEMGPIPKGWKVNQLKDIAFIIMGQSPSSKYYNKNKQGFSFHQGVKDYGWRFPTNITYSTKGKRFAEKGDILFSVRAPVGRINIAGTKLILGRGLAGIRHKDYKNNFLFYSLKTVFTKDDIIGDGTVYKSVNKNDVEGLKILLPNKEILNRFTDIAEPMDLLIESNSKENKTLQDIRDYLLPKLISGKIRVKEAENKLKEVL